jgi:imidazolonepropionase-like amidohydrolase
MLPRMGICFPWFALVFLSGVAGLSAADEGRKTMVFIGAKLVDGAGQTPVENAVLVIQADKISAVGPSGSVKYPDDAEVIDCHGQTIIPGLISDHSHIGLVDGISVKPENYNRDNILRQLRQYEAYGVTTLMALGLNRDLFYQLRNEQHAGQSPGADIFGADRGIGAPMTAPPAALLFCVAPRKKGHQPD